MSKSFENRKGLGKGEVAILIFDNLLREKSVKDCRIEGRIERYLRSTCKDS